MNRRCSFCAAILFLYKVRLPLSTVYSSHSMFICLIYPFSEALALVHFSGLQNSIIWYLFCSFNLRGLNWILMKKISCVFKINTLFKIPNSLAVILITAGDGGVVVYYAALSPEPPWFQSWWEKLKSPLRLLRWQISSGVSGTQGT